MAVQDISAAAHTGAVASGARAALQTKEINLEKQVGGIAERELYEEAPPEKTALIGGFFWWFILGICVILDTLDLVFTALELALAATVIGIVISAIIYVLDIAIDFTMNTVIGGYYSLNGASFARSLILLSIEFIIEQIPVLEMLPMLTVVFVAIRILENRKRNSAAKGGLRGKVTSLAFNRGGKLVGAIAR